jgi:hypothetical protein
MTNQREFSVIFELVLVGCQVLVWVSLLTLAVFGYHWIDLPPLLQWSYPLSALVVGVAYMFGLIFDKAVSALPYDWVIGGSALARIGEGPNPLTMRIEILTKKPEVFEALEKRLNQHRLVRSTVFNMALISVSALVFLTAQIGLNVRLFAFFSLLSVMFVGLSFFTGRRSAETLYFELSHAYEAIKTSDTCDSTDKDGQSNSSESEQGENYAG